MVLPVDLQAAPDEVVELRLETGYLFWEVDYAALDFTNTTDLKTTTLLPRTARDQDRKSQLAALRSDDDQYLQQPYPGQYTELHFPATPAPAGTQQSFFLHVKGYYEHVRDFREAPDMVRLEKFRQPHYFDQFSKAEFQRLQGAAWTAPEPVN